VVEETRAGRHRKEVKVKVESWAISSKPFPVFRSVRMLPAGLRHDSVVVKLRGSTSEAGNLTEIKDIELLWIGCPKFSKGNPDTDLVALISAANDENT